MNMNFQVVKVRPDEIETVHEIIIKCGQDLKLRFDLDHWDPPYPVHAMMRDAKEREVYRVNDGKDIIATFTISTKPLEYYKETLWQHPGDKALYVSHLAVLPERQGKGIGTWCMKYIEHIAVDRDCKALRLDANEKYVKSLEFYEELNYKQREIMKYKDLKLVCFEKII